MKRLFITGVFLLSVLSLTSCRETAEEKTVIKEVEVQKEEPEVEEEEQKGLLERTGEKVDKKVNKEINEEIDKIDDN